MTAQNVKPDENTFLAAINAYHSLISRNYTCRMGDEASYAYCLDVINHLYLDAPEKNRLYLRYLAIKTICEGEFDERLGDWHRQLAVKLANHLEMIG